MLAQQAAPRIPALRDGAMGVEFRLCLEYQGSSVASIAAGAQETFVDRFDQETKDVLRCPLYGRPAR